MKQRILLLLAALMVTVTAVAADDVAVAKALAGRLSTRLADKVEFVQKKSAVDQFTMSGRKGKVVITANNANSMAVGLNHYLQNYCLTNVSWYSNVAVELPDQLPDVKKSVTIKARVPQRFFLNYCTFGYTMPFWQWTEWERLIDWMALNGINMPLAITGQESVWAKVWRQIGLSQKDIDEYFTGPVYLAWHRMANIDGWSGPLPQHWLDSQEQLQKQILARERELNMRPVLNAFAGHVPKKIMELYPDADIKPLEKWDNFPDRYNTVFLNSEDPLYSKIQKIFLDEQTKMYGTDHIYGIDPFNEMTPPSMEADYLANVTKHIYESLTAADPEAEWLQMGWFLYHQRKDYTPERVKAMMESLPKGKMLMLDYFCERTELWRMRDKFSGQPYVWCFLGNFGGATAVQGNVKAAGDKLEKALQEGGDNLVGIGATPEGLDVQQYPLEYIFRKAWTGMADNDTYIKQVARRHAGFDSPAAEEAWKLLQDSIYIGIPYTRGPLFNFRGEFGQDKTAWTRSDIFYKPANMVKAWELLLSQPAVKRDAMNLDLICVGREILGQLFRLEKIEFDKAVQAIDAPAAHKHGEALLGIIKDADRLAAHNTNCTMQKWIKQSRDYGVTKAEKDYYEMNARRLVTIWGGDLCDYANRAWAGLIGDYYYTRWKMYVDQALVDVDEGNKYDAAGYNESVHAFEWEWSTWTDPIPLPEANDVLGFSRSLQTKYADGINVLKTMK